jgi:plastocyanin
VRRFHLATFVALFALVAGGCSKGPDTPLPDPSPSPSTPQPAVSSPEPCADRTGSQFTLAMKDFRFLPDCLVVSETAPFHLHNGGSVRHNLTIPGTGFSVDVDPGKTVGEQKLMSSGIQPGTYPFFCKFHRGKGMTGELHVLAA